MISYRHNSLHTSGADREIKPIYIGAATLARRTPLPWVCPPPGGGGQTEDSQREADCEDLKTAGGSHHDLQWPDISHSAKSLSQVGQASRSRQRTRSRRNLSFILTLLLENASRPLDLILRKFFFAQTLQISSIWGLGIKDNPLGLCLLNHFDLINFENPSGIWCSLSHYKYEAKKKKVNPTLLYNKPWNEYYTYFFAVIFFI